MGFEGLSWGSRGSAPRGFERADERGGWEDRGHRRMCRYRASRVVRRRRWGARRDTSNKPIDSVEPRRKAPNSSKVGANIHQATSADARVRGAMAPWTETPGSETRGAGAPPSTNGTPSTAYLDRARQLAERVQASLETNVRHDALYATLASSPATETFAASRAKELMNELIAAGGDGGWRPAEATPRGGDRRGDDDATVGGSPPRSPRPRRDDDDDPTTPAPPVTTNDAGGRRHRAGARTPSPAPTPVDPIEALLSKVAARGADVPVVVVASSDENVPRKDNDRRDDGVAANTRRRRSAVRALVRARSASCRKSTCDRRADHLPLLLGRTSPPSGPPNRRDQLASTPNDAGTTAWRASSRAPSWCVAPRTIGARRGRGTNDA